MALAETRIQFFVIGERGLDPVAEEPGQSGGSRVSQLWMMSAGGGCRFGRVSRRSNTQRRNGRIESDGRCGQIRYCDGIRLASRECIAAGW